MQFTTIAQRKQELEDQRRKQICESHAAFACNILRQQLCNQEMELRFKAEHTSIYFDYNKGIPYQLAAPPYQFSGREQYKDFKEQKLASLQTTTV